MLKSDNMVITTNNQPRLLHSWRDIPEIGASGDFDYVKESEWDEDRFFKYRDNWYDIHDFMSTNVGRWHGIKPDTYFSGVLIKFAFEDDTIIVGRYYQ